MTRVGIDLVEVARVKRLYKRHGKRFLSRLFTVEEVSYAFSARANRCFERLAVRFAAKEALIKAVGHPLPFCSIAVGHSPDGRPIIVCPLVRERIEASLSHTRGLAIACVLLDKQ